MKGFLIRTGDDLVIRFNFYLEDAPQSCAAFAGLLPFSNTFYHARVSGEEIWCADALTLEIIQENATVFTIPGEVVLGPSKPTRVKTANALGIYYGEGKGLDAANVFARVFKEDLHHLQKLGESIWKHGEQILKFESL